MFPFIYNNTWITDDKVLHFVFSIVISFFLYLFIVKYKKNTFIVYIVKTIVILAVISIIKEVRDYFTPWHNVEFWDVITNYIWFLFFIWVVSIINLCKTTNE